MADASRFAPISIDDLSSAGRLNKPEASTRFAPISLEDFGGPAPAMPMPDGIDTGLSPNEGYEDTLDPARIRERVARGEPDEGVAGTIEDPRIAELRKKYGKFAGVINGMVDEGASIAEIEGHIGDLILQEEDDKKATIRKKAYDDVTKLSSQANILGIGIADSLARRAFDALESGDDVQFERSKQELASLVAEREAIEKQRKSIKGRREELGYEFRSDAERKTDEMAADRLLDYAGMGKQDIADRAVRQFGEEPEPRVGPTLEAAMPEIAKNPAAMSIARKISTAKAMGDQEELDRQKRLFRNVLELEFTGNELAQEAAKNDVAVEALSDALATTRGAARGITFGLSDFAFGAAEKRFGDIDENVSGLGRTGETATSLFGGLSLAGGAIKATQPLVAGATTTAGRIGRRALVQGGVGLAQGAGTNLAALQAGDIDKKEAVANIVAQTVSSAVASPVAATVPGRSLNAAAQVAADFAVDYLSDKYIGGSVDDMGFARWFVERELPNLAVSMAGAGIDYSQAKRNRTSIRRQIRSEIDAAAERYRGLSDEEKAQLEATRIDRSAGGEGGTDAFAEGEADVADIIRRQRKAEIRSEEKAKGEARAGRMAGERILSDVERIQEGAGPKLLPGGGINVRAEVPVKTVTVGESTYREGVDGDWINTKAGAKVKSQKQIDAIRAELQKQQETPDAVQVRETAEVPVGEVPRTGAEVEPEVREQAPPVKAEDKVEVSKENTELIEDAKRTIRIDNEENDWLEDLDVEIQNIIMSKDRKEFSRKLNDFNVVYPNLSQKVYGIINKVWDDAHGNAYSKELASKDKERRVTAKEKAKNLGLDFTGKTEDIEARIKAAEAKQSGATARRQELQTKAKELGLPATGKNADIEARIEEAGTQKPAEPTTQNLRAEAEARSKQGSIINPATQVDSVVGRIKQAVEKLPFVGKRAERAEARGIRATRANELESSRQEIKSALLDIEDVRSRASAKSKNFDQDLARALNEPVYKLADQELERVDLEQMSYRELDSLLKKAGVYQTRPQNMTRKDLVELAVKNATDTSLTVKELAQKYNLSKEDAAKLSNAVKMAEDEAIRLSQIADESGMAVKATTIRQNERYTHKQYLKHLLGKKFTPKPQDVAEAIDDVERGISSSIKRLEDESTRIQKLAGGKADVVSFLQSGDTSAIKNLTPEYRDRMHRLKSVYDALGNAKTGISESGGRVVVGQSAEGLRDAARLVVQDMVTVKPSRVKETGAASSAADALLRRDLKRVYRKLFGEVKDPTMSWAVSRDVQAQNFMRLAVMSDAARASGMVSDVKGGTPNHTRRLGSSQDVGAPVTAYDRQRYGILAGKWTTPELAKELGLGKSSTETETAIGAMASAFDRSVGKLIGGQRGFAVLRPAAIVRDAMTNVMGFMAAAGDLSPNSAKHYAHASDIIRKLVQGKMMQKNPATRAQGARLEAAARRELAYAAKKGIFRHGSSSMIAEIENLLSNTTGAGRAYEATMKLRSLVADFPAKWAGYHERLDNLRKWYKDDLKSGLVKDSDLQKMASDHIYNMYDNRDAIPDWVKRTTKYPIDFFSFRYSNTRAYINAWKSVFEDMKNPKIPISYAGRRLSQMIFATSYQGAATSTKLASLGAATGFIAKAISSLKGEEIGEVEPAGDDVEGAIRFIGPYYYKDESMTVHVDENGNVIQTIWGGGATSPFNLIVDMPTGFIDAWGAPKEAMSKRRVWNRMMEQVVGGKPMSVKTAEDAISSVLEFLDEDRAEKNARSKGIEFDSKKTEIVQKAVSDFTRNAFGWFGRAGLEASGISGKRAEESVTRRIERGGKPMPGVKTEEYMPTRTAREVFVSGLVPWTTRVYTKENIKNNLFNSAYYMNPVRMREGKGLSGKSIESRRAAFADMVVWYDQAKILLEATKTPGDVEKNIDNILKAAGFSEKHRWYLRTKRDEYLK